MNTANIVVIFSFWIAVVSTLTWMYMNQSLEHFNRVVDASGMFVGLVSGVLALGTIVLVETIRETFK